MKNTKSRKFVLSGLILILTIFLNINHCQKNSTTASLELNDMMKISTCQAEENDAIEGDDENLPRVRSLYNLYEKFLDLFSAQ